LQLNVINFSRTLSSNGDKICIKTNMTKLKVSTTEAEKMTYRTCKFTEWLREIYAGLGYFPGKLPTGWGNFKQIYGEPTVNLPKIVKIYRSEQKKKFRKFPGDVGCGLARALLVTEISRKFICSVCGLSVCLA
jgi:hypothetical protein